MSEAGYDLEENMTKGNAIKFLKRNRGQGKSFFISINQEAPIAGAEGKVFPIYNNLNVSLTQALEWVEKAYPDVLCDRGALVAIRSLGKCIFIG